jgi:hypothetical protein
MKARRVQQERAVKDTVPLLDRSQENRRAAAFLAFSSRCAWGRVMLGPPQHLQAPRDTHATPRVEVVRAELGKGVVYLAVLCRGNIASFGNGEHDSHKTELAGIARVLIRLELANDLLDGQPGDFGLDVCGHSVQYCLPLRIGRFIVARA